MNNNFQESTVQNHARLAIAKCGGQVWRNNVGVLQDVNGRPIRYGLANESKRMNEHIKSSDLICVIPITVTQDMVGKRVGVFSAFETKQSDWVYKPTDQRAVAQLNFINIVREVGGFAGFVRNDDDIRQIIRV